MKKLILGIFLFVFAPLMVNAADYKITDQLIKADIQNNGDLLIKINIEDSKSFKLKGNDIYTDLLLTPWEAALGAKANIMSIDDETNVYIPQG